MAVIVDARVQCDYMTGCDAAFGGRVEPEQAGRSELRHRAMDAGWLMVDDGKDYCPKHAHILKSPK